MIAGIKVFLFVLYENLHYWCGCNEFSSYAILQEFLTDIWDHSILHMLCSVLHIFISFTIGQYHSTVLRQLNILKLFYFCSIAGGMSEYTVLKKKWESIFSPWIKQVQLREKIFDLVFLCVMRIRSFSVGLLENNVCFQCKLCWPDVDLKHEPLNL